MVSGGSLAVAPLRLVLEDAFGSDVGTPSEAGWMGLSVADVELMAVRAALLVDASGLSATLE